jgi:hypothetical protein
MIDTQKTWPSKPVVKGFRRPNSLNRPRPHGMWASVQSPSWHHATYQIPLSRHSTQGLQMWQQIHAPILSTDCQRVTTLSRHPFYLIRLSRPSLHTRLVYGPRLPCAMWILTAEFILETVSWRRYGQTSARVASLFPVFITHLMLSAQSADVGVFQSVGLWLPLARA